MGLVLGAFIAKYRGAIDVPRPLRERYADPAYDGEDDPDSSIELLTTLYDGKVHRIEEVCDVRSLILRDIRTPIVVFHRSSIIVLDNDGPIRSDFEKNDAGNWQDGRLTEFSRRPDIASVMVFWSHSYSDSYCFAVFENGTRIRRWSFIPTDVERILRIDEGTQLPTEPTEDLGPETRLLFASKALLDGQTITSVLELPEARSFFCERS